MTEPSPEQQAGATGAVVIAGGGFAGLYTALALAERRHHPPILLIEPNDRFVFLPLLYELLSGELRSWEVAPRYDTLLAGHGVAWLRDRVSAIDTHASSLRTEQGRELEFSKLVIATGSRPTSFGVPGVENHAIGFRTLADVEHLQGLVQELRGRQRPLQRLAVVGAGPSGVELACKLADLLQGAALLELIEQGPELLPKARSFNREQARTALLRRDVRLRTSTRVLAVEADHIQLGLPAAADGSSSEERLAVDGVIWTAGVTANSPSIHPAAAIDGGGRLLCTPELQLRDHPGVFVSGDLAHVEDADGEVLPGTAQVAFQQADQLAGNLLRSIAAEPLEPFLWRDLGEMISLGVGEASLTGLGLTLAGSAAYRIRQLTYLSRLPGRSHQLRVAAGWLSDLGRPLFGQASRS
ncbi:NAD(P)/FAD-dependent oxidoreductase [Synechococcus sp. CS-602]|uniref:NAD(P)/FAD-dependent oxidoreductase n=1 Tax=Synechococcaceae TaxID=1890426 RepID=UPI0008FF7390|nr:MULTISPECIES: NAD(P)/FAD-dependent oxidoreductase [Synechococcaceae]MCT4363899.1 NAD(P)/FAD-dependent oxidoreductase [Candidatus Regnicoccus frigidus MAG-AL1]APD48399.1 NADH dehydrogenase [Synechococcus sp. SynAce01]MCT0201287.1 NAD(P)/FAD-dependent oxidoreductase [Synechococcus sp. CS-603]MCT0205435.1 NAD(P)/FAD-dependent oxidoreductase [Synechococcus sp. CS-602]MCT0245943.1 NAD(P)/FAD-dependent oxidoreductase [Synechococcus sp. CS-601]